MIKINTTQSEKEILFGIMEKYDTKGISQIGDPISKFISGNVDINDLDKMATFGNIMEDSDFQIFESILKIRVAESLDNLNNEKYI